MKFRTITIITVSLISILIFGALQTVAVFVINPSFINLENQEMKESIIQANITINHHLPELEAEVRDYSLRAGTHNFTQNGNQEYIKNSFVEATFEQLDVNLIAIVSNRSLVYYQSFDLNNSAMVQTSEQTRSSLTSDDYIWAFPSTESIISGIMLVDNKPMLVATAPILTISQDGQIMEGMLFGKYVSYEEINELASMGHNISISTISDFRLQKEGIQIADSLLSNEHTAVVKEDSSDKVSGYTLIRDIHSNPMFILQVSHQRLAYQQGIWMTNIFLTATLVLSFSLGAGILLLLQRNIVKPMAKLASYIRIMPQNPDASQPKTNFRTEEMRVLATSVRDTLNRKLEGMNEVSRMVGHDLRNPLTGIKGASYILKKNHVPKTDKKGNALLKTIDDCVEYSDKIVRDLVEYSCEINLDKIKTNPKRLVNDSLSKFVVPSSIQVINEASDEFSLLVDNWKIERVFSNLIKNAFDAMPDVGKLEITSRRVNGQVEVDFSDSGVGMSKDVLEKLWTPFFTTKAKGMGVGLSISKRIIDAHGGRIEAKSIEGKGTCFTVFLPVTE